MAVSAPVKVAGDYWNDRWESGSYTPSPNSLCIAHCTGYRNSGPFGIETPAGWTKLGEIYRADQFLSAIFAKEYGATPSADNFLANATGGGILRGKVIVFEMTGHEPGSYLAQAIVERGYELNMDSGSPSINLGAAPNGMVLGIFGGSSSNDAVGVTPGAPFTEVYDEQGDQSFHHRMQLQYDTNATATLIDWYGVDANHWVAVFGLEIAAEESGPGPEPGDENSFTLVMVHRAYDPPETNRVIAAKRTSGAPSAPGYSMFIAAGQLPAVEVADGVDERSDISARVYDGTLFTETLRADRTAGEVEVFVNAIGTGSPGDISSLGSFVNEELFTVGRYSPPGTNYTDMEFVGGAIVRRAISDEEIQYLYDYFKQVALPPVIFGSFSSAFSSAFDV